MRELGAHNMGVGRPEGRRSTDWTQEAEDRLRALLSEGHSYGEVARRMGLNRGTVIGKAKRMGLRSAVPQPGSTPEHAKKREARRSAPSGDQAVARPTRATKFRVPAPVAGTPPHVTTKQGRVLHVYARPTDMTPVATFDRHGDWWVRRDRPEQRHRSARDAARGVGV